MLSLFSSSETKTEPNKATVLSTNVSRKIIQSARANGVTLMQKTRGRKGRKVKTVGKTWNVLSMRIPMTVKPARDSRVFTFCQEQLGANSFSTSASVPAFYSANFYISGLAQITSLTAVFDQYRIALIEVWLKPNVQSTTNTAGDVATVLDYDDATPLTAFSDATNYDNCIVDGAQCGHYRKFVPHAALAAYSGTFTSYCNVPAPWIDAASTSVQHYGFKVAATATGQVISYDLIVRYHLEFRCVR